MLRSMAIAAALFVCLPALSQSVSFNPISIPKGGQVIGDFNADGREDILSYYSPGHFQLQISNADGNYFSEPPVAIPNGGDAAGFAVGDFNRDGNLDLVVLSSAQNSKVFYVYLGNGDGTLRTPVAHTLSFLPYSAIVAADVNHDGKMDLVFMNSPSNSVTTFVTELGNGSGGFTAGPVSNSTYYGLYNLYSGDFDGDGKADLFSATCGPGGCNLIAFYGDGAGRFGSPTTGSANQSNWTVADVDRDGKSDIISSTMGYINSKDQPYLSVWYGASNRTLVAKQIPTSQCTFGQPAVGDFNGDHIPDIIFPEHSCTGSSAEIAFLAGKGARTFGSEQTLFNSTSAQSPGGATAVMRGNRDTKPDLFFSQSASTSGGATQTYYVLMNQTSGKFAACTAPNHPTGFHVCSPASSSTVYSPVKFSIGASGQVPMRKVEVWVDGVKKYESLYGFSHYAFLDASIPLSSGTHAIAVFAAGWDNSLQLKQYSITVH